MRPIATVLILATTFTIVLCATALGRGFVPGKLGPSVRAASALVPPLNDGSASFLAMNDFAFGNNAEATEDSNELLTWRDPDLFGCTSAGTESTSGWPMRNTIWYWVEGTGRTLSFYATGGSIDTIVAIYDESFNMVRCSDDVLDHPSYRWSALRVASQAGRDYFVQVGSACTNRVWGGATRCGGAAGSGLLLVGAATQPADDDRAAASTLVLGQQTTQSLLGATEESGENVDCDGSPFGKTRWFRVNVPSAGTLTVAATSAGHDSILALYPTGGSTRLACNDDTEGTSSSAQMSIAVAPGNYDIQLGGFLPGVLADDSESTVISYELRREPGRRRRRRQAPRVRRRRLRRFQRGRPARGRRGPQQRPRRKL